MNRKSPKIENQAPVSKDGQLVAGICLFLALIVCLVFGQTLNFDFVNFDDGQYVSDNAAVTAGVTMEGVESAFSSRTTDNWVPLTTISHMMDCQFYGLRARGHHFTNVLLHMGAVIFLFLALVKMTNGLFVNRRRDRTALPHPLGEGGLPADGLKDWASISPRENIWRCAVVAAVFAVHPLRAESVAWVSERKDVLCGFFFALTLWIYAGYARDAKSLVRYLTALFFAALALMSKPVAVTLAFVLLLLDYWPLRRFPAPFNLPAQDSPIPLPFPVGGGRIIVRLIAEKIPFLVLALASCLPTILTERQGIALTTVVPIPLRIENALVSCVVYIKELFFPVHLTAFYYYPIVGIPFLKVGAAVAFLGAVSVAVFYFGRKYPYLPVGWLWYLGMLVPVIGLVQVGSQAHADRHTYLSEIGLGLMLTWLAGDLMKLRLNRPLIPGVLFGGILVILMCSGARQVSFWRNGGTLWSHAVDCDRSDVRAYYDLANYLDQKGDLDGAMTNYVWAIRIDPNLVGAHNNLGMVLAAKDDLPDAMTQYQQAIKLFPDYAVAHYDLGTALLKEKDYDGAIAEFQKALAIDPGHSEPRNNADLALPAVTAARMKITYAQFHNALGMTLGWEGRQDEAITEYQKALQLNPNYPEASYNLANALLKEGQVGAGVAQFQNALKGQPDDARTHNNLGTALRKEGQLDEAIEQYQEALKIDPNYAPAHYNLGNTLLQKGQLNSAIVEYEAALKLKPDNAIVQNNVARAIWILATATDDLSRNGTNAVQFAQAANDLTGSSNPLILRVLAAAFAETGNFPAAIKTANESLTLASGEQNGALQDALKQEILNYQSGKPTRADPTDMTGW